MEFDTVARLVLETEANTLLAARDRLDGDFRLATDMILERCPPGKVVVMGVGKSGHIGAKIAATLASTGTPAFFDHPTEAAHGDLGVITAADVVLAVSYSGASEELLRVLPYLKRHAVPTISLSGERQSPLVKHADFWIDCGVQKEACLLGLAPTASTTLALALGDALAMCLLHQRGFTSDDFAATHPHGALGRRLLVTVGDIMLKDVELPSVCAGDTVRASIAKMSGGGIGVVGVTGDDGVLIGVYTDGDLRRSLDGNVDIHTVAIADVMTRAPLAMKADQLAVEAAELMECGKVNAIMVVDDGNRLIGALNMRLLLRSGVI